MKVSNKYREFHSPAYYHVYNRGVATLPIFLDNQDRSKFLSLIDRYTCNSNNEVRGDGLAYQAYDIKIIAYCLMDNHFHLFIFQPNDSQQISAFMKSLLTAYSMYFNLRYKRRGPMFEGMFQATHITNDAHYIHLSRYIHLNPRYYRTYRWSSLPDYLGRRDTPWLHPALVNDMAPTQYLQFLEDYEDRKQLLKQIKNALGI